MGQQRKEERPKLTVPYSLEKNEDKVYYKCNSSDMKIVSDYTRLSFFQIDELEIFDYYSYLHDAVVWNCNKTADGRDYLEKAYTHSASEPDRAALRKYIK